MQSIRVHDVVKRLGGKLALDKVSLEIASTEFHVLLGLSGSGKSTLLRIIMGLIPPDAGDVQIGARNLAHTDLRSWVQSIGYIPQEGGLFPHLSAQHNITLVAETLNWTRERIEHRLEEMVDLTNLDRALLKRYPRELSGGQRQRIALMRAAFLDPEVMILDEPMGALDPILRSELQNDLRAAFQRLGKTVLMVTHDLSEAAKLAQKVTLLKDGRVIQTGEMRDLFERPANEYVKRFIGSQQVQLSHGS